MEAALLVIHVLAAVILIGPITVAASVFPRYARNAAAATAPSSSPALPVAAAMHRISRGYALPALAVPVFGIGLAAAMRSLGQGWLIAAVVLTVAAGGLLAFVIVPSQTATLDFLRDRSEDAIEATARALRTLGMVTGLFATLWAIVVVLMIVRPGSSTGV